jgi:hypothetical protein
MSQTANIVNGSTQGADQTNSNTSAPAVNNCRSTSPASNMNSQNSSPPVLNNNHHHYNGTNHSFNISNFWNINFNHPISTSNADGEPKESEKDDGSADNTDAIQAKHKAGGKREVHQNLAALLKYLQQRLLTVLSNFRPKCGTANTQRVWMKPIDFMIIMHDAWTKNNGYPERHLQEPPSPRQNPT